MANSDQFSAKAVPLSRALGAPIRRSARGGPALQLRKGSSAFGTLFASIGAGFPWLRAATSKERQGSTAVRPLERMGAKAIRMGFATKEQVRRALSYQQEREAVDAARPPLGALLVQMGVLAPAQLAQLLAESANGFQLSGDALRLAATLRRAIDDGVRVIVFTGVGRAHGAALVAAQVGLALALMDQGPLTIVDCDFRRPSLDRLFGLKQESGTPIVAGGLHGDAQALRETGITGLTVLPAGEPSSEAIAELLGQSGAAFLERLRASKRLVILSAPPAAQCPETAILAARADATVIVVAAGVGHGAEVAEVDRLMAGVGAKVFGVILSQDAT
jgi:Mrp family chromosome partitioning ATPase